ncbi:hypothetical protein Tco_0477214 [Tanacetum coccineum]
MSQFPNDGYFTSLLNTSNPQHSSSSNPSTPSSQNSISSSQPFPPFGTQYNAYPMAPEQIYQQQASFQYQRNASSQSFQPQQSQPQYFQPKQSQSQYFESQQSQQTQPQFKEPQPKEIHRKGKRMAKKSNAPTVDLDAEMEDEQVRNVQRLTQEEEKLLCEC